MLKRSHAGRCSQEHRQAAGVRGWLWCSDQHRYDHSVSPPHKQVHADIGSYIQFKDIVIKHHHGMQASCGESYDQPYTAILEALLPRTASALWSQHTAKNPHPPTLKDFLDRRIESTETLSNTNKHPPTQLSNYQACKPRPKERSNSNLREAKTETCPVSDTFINVATSRSGLLEKRHRLARRKHNCLSSNHSDSCPSRHTCRECHQKHHTLLHRFPALTHLKFTTLLCCPSRACSNSTGWTGVSVH